MTATYDYKTDPFDGCPLHLTMYGNADDFFSTYHLRSPISTETRAECMRAALETGKVDVVRFLVSQGTDISLQSMSGLITMYWNPSRGSHQPEAGLRMARYLIDEHGFDIYNGPEGVESTVDAIKREGIVDAMDFLRELGVPEERLV